MAIKLVKKRRAAAPQRQPDDERPCAPGWDVSLSDHFGWQSLSEGARACPPEDCGGVPGFAEFLEAIADVTHPEHAELLRWVGGRYAPEAFNPAGVKFSDPKRRWNRAFGPDAE